MLPLRMLGPLMFIILLCDADSTCPTMLNPLTLSPPVVIEEHGKIVAVNCSSTEEDHYGMYWKTGNKKSDTEDDRSFIPEYLNLTDWDITAECIIQLNESFECSKDLEIIVYRNPDLSMFPTKYAKDLVEGTLYELQCDIIEVAPIQNLTVRWYKNNQTIKTESFTNTTKRPAHESSTLILNISREDDGAQFHCEAQLDFGPYGIQPAVISELRHISVLYAPKFKKNTQKDFYYLNEGNDVTLNCEAEGNPPPVFNWARDGLNMLEKTDHLHLIQVKDSAIYDCTASNHLGNISKQISVVRIISRMEAPLATTVKEASTLSATEALPLTTHEASASTTPKASTQNTPEASSPTSVASTPDGCPLVLTPAEIVVKFGDPASINCSTSATDAFLIGWEAILGGTVTNPPGVTWKIDKLEEWTIEPKCFMTKNNNEQCTEMPVITVYKTPDIVSVSAMSPGPVVEGKDFLLTCDIIHVAPLKSLKLKWYKGNETVHTQSFSNTTVGPCNASSTLKVTPKKDDNGAAFICKAELLLGPKGPHPMPSVTSSPYKADVHYAPEVNEENKTIEVTQGENVTFHCSAEANPPPKITWMFPTAVNVKETTGRHYRSITVTGATSTNAGVYICNATNSIGSGRRFVTVNMKSQTSVLPLGLISVLLILCVVLLIIAIIILHNRWKKNGQYSFVPNKATDDLPMTSKPEA